ncbi:MAG TPA: hypothetical protein VLE73_02465 [Candidatus Saccharimonadales bacterium]|nr:hypothetical protein [Candidatus Saccharimonadales bacterium]
MASILFCGLGVLGAMLLLFGFYRVSSGKWTNKSFLYELDNVCGALLLLAYQVRYGAYVSAVLNAVWAGIAFIGIVRLFSRYRLYNRPKTVTRTTARSRKK